MKRTNARLSHGQARIKRITLCADGRQNSTKRNFSFGTRSFRKLLAHYGPDIGLGMPFWLAENAGECHVYRLRDDLRCADYSQCPTSQRESDAEEVGAFLWLGIFKRKAARVELKNPRTASDHRLWAHASPDYTPIDWCGQMS